MTGWIAATVAVAGGVAEAGEKVSFNDEIRPLLSNVCFRCHGPDQDKRKADLRLDTREGAMEDHDGFRAVVPGDVEESELIYRITSDDPDDVMPPPEKGDRFTPEQVALMKRWIAEGAEYDVHWAYQQPKRRELPQVETADFVVRGAVDAFVLAKMEAVGLEPSPEAARHTLARRVALDLTGLPPTWEEVEAFLADDQAGAYERFVDRLLAKPAFGEHWARMWLDLARYADSAGYADDPPRTIWAYRDYIIRSFNDNKPLDRFTIEQLAGDLLEEPTQEQLVATAFHRNTQTNSEGGTDDEEFRNAAIVDRVNTTMTTWMGTTMACAQCHTHKYDPLTQDEYFRMFAIFNNTADADRKNESPTIEVPAAGGVPKTTVPVMREMEKGRETRIQRRGNFQDLGEQVGPGVPEVFGGLGAKVKADRLALARWLVGERNPLTARVLANRFWEKIFEAGLVATSEEFGSQGEAPSHPELLDWLAVDLRESGWDMKAFLRMLVTSSAYRQSSHVPPELEERDPANRYLARGPRVRLTAEMVRDQALAASGLLSAKMFGPPVRPPQPRMGLKAAFGGGIDWKTSEGEDRYRRGIYTNWRRSNPYPSMVAFDAPNREVCLVRRDRTNTPLQALVTLNDPVYIEAAQALARRMSEHEDIGAAIDLAFRECLSRPAKAGEKERLGAFYEEVWQRYAKDAGLATKMATDPLGPVEGVTDYSRLAALTVVGNVVLNLDELLMKR
jgi:cytochrome c553